MKKTSLSAIPVTEGKKANSHWGAIASSVILTTGMLCIVQVMVERPMLMIERFSPGSGWLEIVVLALYAGFITPKILNPATSVRWRTILWLTFSIIFFSQLMLGILGLEHFLMSGRLHLPIPALIIAGPVYRGENFFMPILFGSTLLFIGPAWCSYFCYLGGWDFLASQQLKRSKPMPKWRQSLRIAILLLVVGTAWFFRQSETSATFVVWLAALYGLGGIAVMLLFSRRQGNMVHCSTYCPIGLVANVLGKISPFRMRINDSCTGCRKCSRVCRYDALNPADLDRGRPGLSCTLCGDCIGSCRNSLIYYCFPGLSQRMARTMFVVIVVSFHAVSIGVARI
jgi:polyferredoxin